MAIIPSVPSAPPPMTPPNDPIPAVAPVAGTSTSAAANISAPPGPAMLPGERPPSAAFVRLTLFFALALTATTVGLVGWRWLMVRFPNAALVTRGDASADGVEVVVRADDGREVARGSLSADNAYEFPVLVEQGVYTVRASRDGKMFQELRYYVPDARGVLAEVTVPPALRAATRPAATRPTATP